jgi:hypothetical protein
MVTLAVAQFVELAYCPVASRYNGLCSCIYVLDITKNVIGITTGEGTPIKIDYITNSG